ncbi:MAG: RNA polymerase sigma factor [Candidatus Cyclobacteriaceae bacterium M2_1C_046]
MHQIDDNKIIDRVLSGDEEAYAVLVNKHKSYAYTIALKVVEIEEEAEEVAQDAFIKAYQNLNKFNREAKFSTWLYRIVFNTAISYKRKGKIKKESIEIVKYTHAADENVSSEHQDRKIFIARALEKLPPADKTVITLFYLKELSLDEIADITGMKSNAVKVKLHRARKKLAEELQVLLKQEALTL